MQREISCSPNGPPLSTVYIGGGTPSILSPKQIDFVLKQLRDHFGIVDGAEITLEMDPASFLKEDLEDFLEIGINRISLGCQSFDNILLERIGRRHRLEDILESCEWLENAQKKGNLETWSIDLIQNLPGHNLSAWRCELIQSILTKSPHISIYDLTIEHGTVFEWRRKKGQLDIPDSSLAAESMELTPLILREAGFSRYEISNYALPGHASRHNRVYWSGCGWWAFGQGATSSPWGKRLERPRTRDTYKNWVESQEVNGPDPTLMQSGSMPMALDERIIVGLRRREGIDLEGLLQNMTWTDQERTSQVEALEKRLRVAFEVGSIQRNGKRIKLSDPYGMAISNDILSEFIVWLDSL